MSKIFTFFIIIALLLNSAFGQKHRQKEELAKIFLNLPIDTAFHTLIELAKLDTAIWSYRTSSRDTNYYYTGSLMHNNYFKLPPTSYQIEFSKTEDYAFTGYDAIIIAIRLHANYCSRIIKTISGTDTSERYHEMAKSSDIIKQYQEIVKSFEKISAKKEQIKWTDGACWGGEQIEFFRKKKDKLPYVSVSLERDCDGKLYQISIEYFRECTECYQSNTAFFESKIEDNYPASYDKIFPERISLFARVLTVGEFHDDEVSEYASEGEWFGLFKGKKNYYLKQTEIETIKIHDPIIDENEDEMTGWKVQTTNKDTCLILIASLPFLKNRDVKSVKLPKNYIYPGDTVSFKYLGVKYKIFATGDPEVQPMSDWIDVRNYKLYLTASIKGEEHTTILVACRNFKDKMPKIIFAGDTDGDGILDLIIDTSRHYNVTNPTIYLSQPANKKDIVKPVGSHVSVGC
jgi:hypothetical protein